MPENYVNGFDAHKGRNQFASMYVKDCQNI